MPSFETVTPQEREARLRAIKTVGVALVSGAAVLTGLVFLVRETGKGRGLRVQITHDLSPGTKEVLAQLGPAVDKLSTDGVRVRFGPAPRGSKARLLSSLGQP